MLQFLFVFGNVNCWFLVCQFRFELFQFYFLYFILLLFCLTLNQVRPFRAFLALSWSSVLISRSFVACVRVLLLFCECSFKFQFN